MGLGFLLGSTANVGQRIKPDHFLLVIGHSLYSTPSIVDKKSTANVGQRIKPDHFLLVIGHSLYSL